MTLASTRRSGARRRPTTWSGLVVGAALLLAAAAGCAKSDKPTGSANKQGLSTVDQSGTPTAPATATTSSSHPSSAPTTTSAKPNKTSNAPTGPKITTFAVTLKASCGSPGGPGFDPVAGSVKLSWAVTGATKVGLSIDDTNTFKQTGHGSWKDYPAVSSDTLPFACSGTAGNKTHTYTLDTIDGGAHVSKTLTLTAYWEGA